MSSGRGAHPPHRQTTTSRLSSLTGASAPFLESRKRLLRDFVLRVELKDATAPNRGVCGIMKTEIGLRHSFKRRKIAGTQINRALKLFDCRGILITLKTK